MDWNGKWLRPLSSAFGSTTRRSIARCSSGRTCTTPGQDHCPASQSRTPPSLLLPESTSTFHSSSLGRPTSASSTNSDVPWTRQVPSYLSYSHITVVLVVYTVSQKTVSWADCFMAHALAIVTTLCLKKTVQICFCQNLGKFPPILIIFDR